MITPEQARELLDGTVPGPWLCEKDGDEYEFVIGTEDFGIITEVNRESDGRLIAAAPALAELVANLRTEYAVLVQTYSSGDQPYLTKTGGHTFNPDRANWFRGRGFARSHGMMFAPRHFRIVRRLMSDPEVVE